MKNLIFDYDGTLHNAVKIYEPAFLKAYDYLLESGYAQKQVMSSEKISHWLGFSAKDMWDNFMPNLPTEIKDKCSKIIGDEMLRLVQCNKAQLYPDALDVLGQLKNLGYNLIFLSNCKHMYMEAHNQAFGLDDYFGEFYCTEDYDFKPKYIIFETIKEKYDGEFIIIGDRFQDMEVAHRFGLKAIACRYGYGSEDELLYATYVVNKVSEIKVCVESMG